ncbi:MAG: hypothetical protein PUD73_09465 [bacterium]|nr:hypothetical protein [bacterium]
MATESFDHIDTSSFERQMCIAEDPAILQSPDRNPILIDEALSKDEGLSVGDTLVLPNCLTKEPVVFTVGAIYRRTSLFAQYDAVILCNEQINPIFYAVEENMCFTAAYVKASDLQGLTDYLENEFVPGLLVKNSELTQEEIDAIPREEIAAYYENYAYHQHRS